MARIALLIFLVFAALLALRMLRVSVETFVKRQRGRQPPRGAVAGAMVRDPVCGTWIDRRLAIAGRRGSEWHPVCSEECRKMLEEARS